MQVCARQLHRQWRTVAPDQLASRHRSAANSSMESATAFALRVIRGLRRAASAAMGLLRSFGGLPGHARQGARQARRRPFVGSHLFRRYSRTFSAEWPTAATAALSCTSLMPKASAQQRTSCGALREIGFSSRLVVLEYADMAVSFGDGLVNCSWQASSCKCSPHSFFVDRLILL